LPKKGSGTLKRLHRSLSGLHSSVERVSLPNMPACAAASIGSVGVLPIERTEASRCVYWGVFEACRRGSFRRREVGGWLPVRVSEERLHMCVCVCVCVCVCMNAFFCTSLCLCMRVCARARAQEYKRPCMHSTHSSEGANLEARAPETGLADGRLNISALFSNSVT
jgi:hypothetical protein